MRQCLACLMSWPGAKRLLKLFFGLFVILLFCEYLVYYLVLLQCTWPELSGKNEDPFLHSRSEADKPLRVMLLSDTHLLGWRLGHWFDKLRREWQMHRSFQSAMFIHQPDIVFVLGDLMDEGKWASDQEFQQHVKRFKRLFYYDPKFTKMKVVAGNHDMGFHYDITQRKSSRFKTHFNEASSVRLFSISSVHFVMLNSMAFEQDGCFLCKDADRHVKGIANRLSCARGDDLNSKLKCDELPVNDKGGFISGGYSRPIILQHFPLYRKNDLDCPIEEDSMPPDQRGKEFQPKIDSLSKEASDSLLTSLNPRLVVSGHTHYSCIKKHPVDDDLVPEWSIPSFSWRNINTPAFLLMKVTPRDYSINKCQMPRENSVIIVYVISISVLLVWFLWPLLIWFLHCVVLIFRPSRKSE